VITVPEIQGKTPRKKLCEPQVLRTLASIEDDLSILEKEELANIVD